MKKTKLVKEKRQRICLYLEKLIVIAFLGVTIAELVIILNLISYYRENRLKYFYYLMENRLVIKNYLGRLNPILTTEYIKKNNNCDSVYWPMKNFELDSVTLVGLTEKTNITMMRDKHINSKTGIVDNENAKLKFYQYDLSNKGTSTINFITRYNFINWRKFILCKYTIDMEASDSILFFPVIKNCSDIGEEGFDCGVYHDSYRMCLNLKKLKIKEDYLYDLLNSSKIERGYICPYNYFFIDFKNLADAKLEDIDKYRIRIRANSPPADKPELKNKNLLIREDRNLVGEFINITDPSIQLKDLDNPYTLQPNTSKGFKDELNDFYDNYEFVDFYNNSFYDGPVVNKLSNYTTFEPNSLKGESGTDYYVPIDSAEKKMRIYLSFYGLKVFPPSCFENIINKEGTFQYDFLKIIYKNSTSFLFETLYLMLAWVLVKLVISYYWDVRIRWFVITNLLSNRLNQADIDSEYITKITPKAFLGPVYAILIYGAIFHQMSFMEIVKNCGNLIEYQCFADPIINKSIQNYIDFINVMQTQNQVLILLLVTSGGMQGFFMIYYVLDVAWIKAQENLLNLVMRNNQPNKEDNLDMKKD